MNQEPSVFTRIINRELPAEILYEDDEVIVINNIRPMAPVHLLGITKQPFENIHHLLQSEGNKDLLWKLFSVLSRLAAERGLDKKGYKLTTNNGADAGQSVFHLHVHLLGGRTLQE